MLKTAVQTVNNTVLVQLDVRLVSAKRPTRNFKEFFSHLKRLHFMPRTVIDIGVAWRANSCFLDRR